MELIWEKASGALFCSGYKFLGEPFILKTEAIAGLWQFEGSVWSSNSHNIIKTSKRWNGEQYTVRFPTETQNHCNCPFLSNEVLYIIGFHVTLHRYFPLYWDLVNDRIQLSCSQEVRSRTSILPSYVFCLCLLIFVDWQKISEIEISWSAMTNFLLFPQSTTAVLQQSL